MLQPIDIFAQAARELKEEPLSRRQIQARQILSNVRLYLEWPEFYWKFRKRHGSAVEALMGLIEKGE